MAIAEIEDCPLLDNEIKIGYSPDGVKGYKWPTMTSTVRQLCEFLSKHEVGKKDGMSILQGTVIASKSSKVSDRKANAVDQLSLLIFDIDTGEDIDRIEKRIRELGLFSIIHTTYSHNSTETTIKKDAVLRWIGNDEIEPTPEQVFTYMREIKRTTPAIVQSARLEATRQENEGVMLVVSHKPMPKLRVIFVLEKPFVIADRSGSQKKAIEEWKERYIGVAKLINATVDRVCIDPSHLMYTPRHPKGRDDFEVRFTAGEALDLEDVERISLKGEATNNAWIEEGDKERKEYKTTGLLKFVAKYSEQFDVVEFLRNYGEVRKDDGLKISIQCPNDDAHSDTGNPIDVGFFGAISESGSFVMKCMHDSCSELDRVDMLDLMCTENDLSVDDLKGYVNELEEDEETLKEDVPFENIEEIVDWLADPETAISPNRIEEFMKLVAGFKPTTIQNDQICDLVFRKTGVKRATLSKTINEEVKHAKIVEDSEESGIHDLPKDVVLRLEEESKSFFVVLMKGEIRVIKKNNPRNTDEPYHILPVETYRQLRANESVEAMYHGELKKFNVGKEFFFWGGRPTYDDGLVFEPAGGKGKVYNHWSGWKVQPKKGDCRGIKNHLFHVICKENEEYFDWLMTWFAHLFQFPGEKIGVAVVVRGKKGAGKSIIFEEFLSNVLGNYFFKASNAKHVTGQFNGHLFGNLLLVLEEAIWAGDQQSESTLKDLISSEHMTYEFKGHTPFLGSNYTRLIFISNENWVVPATYDERRFFVLNPSDEYVGDMEYFEELSREIYDPESQAAFVYEMMNMRVENFNILRSPPKTEWLSEQISQTLAPEDQFFIEMVDKQGLDEIDGLGDSFEKITLDADESTEIDLDTLYGHYKLYIERYGAGTLRRAKPWKAFLSKVKTLLKATIRDEIQVGIKRQYAAVPPLPKLKKMLNKEGYGPL